MVDTLEKYQEAALTTESQERRDFLVFKKQLYQIYEIKNRSVHEHEAYSFALERQNLKWLYNANLDYLREMRTVDAFDQMADTGALKGKIFKAKLLTPDRLKGASSLFVSLAAYTHMVPLTLMFGSIAPVAAVVSTAVYGMHKFAEQDTVGSIEHLENGNLKIQISKSPLVSYTITCHQNDIVAVCSVGDDDLGADDVEGNILHIAKFVDSNGEHRTNGVFKLPADAYRDKPMMEWIMAPKNA